MVKTVVNEKKGVPEETGQQPKVIDVTKGQPATSQVDKTLDKNVPELMDAKTIVPGQVPEGVKVRQGLRKGPQDGSGPNPECPKKAKRSSK
jgi:hypothetical protein